VGEDQKKIKKEDQKKEEFGLKLFPCVFLTFDKEISAEDCCVSWEEYRSRTLFSLRIGTSASTYSDRLYLMCLPSLLNVESCLLGTHFWFQKLKSGIRISAFSPYFDFFNRVKPKND